MAQPQRSGRYPGKFRYTRLTLANGSPAKMRDKLDALPFLGYHVETLRDGRKVCITKPGGKSPFGRMKVSDFMVWVYDRKTQDRWRPSHKEIYDDLEFKLENGRRAALFLINRLHLVCKGVEPNRILSKGVVRRFSTMQGIPPDLILKVYKWIWIQEDCNYPTGEGRWMSMKNILALGKRFRRVRGV